MKIDFCREHPAAHPLELLEKIGLKVKQPNPNYWHLELENKYPYRIEQTERDFFFLDTEIFYYGFSVLEIHRAEGSYHGADIYFEFDEANIALALKEKRKAVFESILDHLKTTHSSQVDLGAGRLSADICITRMKKMLKEFDDMDDPLWKAYFKSKILGRLLSLSKYTQQADQALNFAQQAQAQLKILHDAISLEGQQREQAAEHLGHLVHTQAAVTAFLTPKKEKASAALEEENNF